MLKTRIKLILFIFLILNHFSAIAQSRENSSISQSDLRRHLEFLASDEISGRSLETPDCGICKAAGYLKENVAKMGLKEGFPGFIQTVPLVSSAPDTINSFIEIRDKQGKLIDRTSDITSVFAGESFNVKNAPVVFAGFGFKDGTSGYDDFSGIDLTGKVVVFSTGTPSSFNNSEKMQWNNQLEMDKTDNAIKAGAAAVVLVTSPADSVNELFHRVKSYLNRENWSLANTAQKIQNNFVIISPEQADKMLGGKGDYRKLLSNIANTKKTNSFIVKNTLVTIGLNRKIRAIESANVVAVVEGSDPVLKNECVIFMAHYDHLGVGKNGDVYNGADDNGSGTVTLLELADAYSKLKKKPKRSIVFLWVTGEELGMLGSRFYTENPLFPLTKTAACVNLDMVGRVFEPRDSVWNRSPKKVKDFDGIFVVTNKVWPHLKEIAATACAETGLIPDFSLPPYFLGSSDHASFDKKGVAILNLSTGYHADYHKPGDEIEKINFNKMKRIADLCFLIGLEVARLETIPNLN